MAVEHAQVILYTSYLHTIGGIETFVYNFVAILGSTYDITVMSPQLPAETIVKLSRKVRVVRPQPMDCDTLIMLRIMDEKPQAVTYKKLIRVCHACKVRPEWKITQDYDYLVNVSEASKKSFGDEAKDGVVIHNMLKVNAKKSLFLVSATRLPAKDKGANAERMLTLANMLEKSGIPYIWLNFSDGKLQNAPKGFVNVGRTDEMQSFIAKADYLVQLSDAEGFCYSVAEALANKVPVIVTPFEAAVELGVVGGVNGYIVPFDMNFDVKQLLDVPEFDYEYDNTDSIKKWKKLLGAKSRKKYKSPKMKIIKITRTYKDMQLNRMVHAGEYLTVTPDRASEIITGGCGEIYE